MDTDVVAMPGRRRVLWVGVAIVAAVLAAALAPAAWPVGDGALALRAGGRTVAATVVAVGTDAPERLAGTAGERVLVLELPGGVPVDAAVTGTLAVEVEGDRVRPSPDEVGVVLELSDGRVEPIPLLAWDPDAQALVATRRPPVRAATALGLLAAAVVLWISGAIPLFATAIAIPVVLVATGVTDAVAALAPFFHPIIALFFAGFLLAEAMRRVELDTWVAGRLVGLGAGHPVRLVAVVLATSAFLSMWMSNTAAVAVLIPIALAIAAPVGHPGFTRMLVLGTAWAATLGGVGSAIGTPANLLAIEYLDAFGIRRITFAEWFAFGLPLVVVLLPVIGGYLWWRQGVRLGPDELAGAVPAGVGGFGRDRSRVAGVFALVTIGWLTQGWHGVHPGIVALAGVVVLALTGDVREQDLGRISWTALLTFGGGLALGLALTETGVADAVASALAGMAALPELVAVAVVATVTLLLTTVASNTASAATLIPLAIPLAGLLGVDVTTLVVIVAIASSIDFALIIGTPPTMMAYSTGLFRPAEILRSGAVLDAVGLGLLLTLVVAAWRWFGVVPG